MQLFHSLQEESGILPLVDRLESYFLSTISELVDEEEFVTSHCEFIFKMWTHQVGQFEFCPSIKILVYEIIEKLYIDYNK